MRAIWRRRTFAATLATLAIPAALALAISDGAAGEARGEDAFTRTEDVVYGRKDGMALTLDVFTPNKDANGAAIVWVVSGGYFSSHEAIHPAMVREFLKRGYTCFAVVHGSQPRYTIPDAVADLNRSIRFIRYNARRFAIDPNRIGITGGSAGGHLSLMQGTAGDYGNPRANDPIDRVSSRVQAVACFFPPTDFLNYGTPGNVALGTGLLKDFRAPFEFREVSAKSRTYVQITDEKRILEIARSISPGYQVSKDDPPTLILHGDADKLVPIQQAELMMAKFKEAGVPAELVVRKGQAHGWLTILDDLRVFADWFDKHLAKK
jgi:acetyl esterase/lipase